jgi:hypothetical protein
MAMVKRFLRLEVYIIYMTITKCFQCCRNVRGYFQCGVAPSWAFNVPFVCALAIRQMMSDSRMLYLRDYTHFKECQNGKFMLILTLTTKPSGKKTVRAQLNIEQVDSSRIASSRNIFFAESFNCSSYIYICTSAWEKSHLLI